MTKTLTKEQFLANKRTWSSYCEKRTQGHPEHHLLRTLSAGHDPFKAFHPLTNERWVPQGKTDYWALRQACSRLRNILRQSEIALERESQYKYAEKPGFLSLTSLYIVTSDEYALRLHVNKEMIAELYEAIDATVKAIPVTPATE